MLMCEDLESKISTLRLVADTNLDDVAAWPVDVEKLSEDVRFLPWFTAALDLLIEHGWLRRAPSERTGKPGRPSSSQLEVNPKAFGA